MATKKLAPTPKTDALFSTPGQGLDDCECCGALAGVRRAPMYWGGEQWVCKPCAAKHERKIASGK